MNDATGLPASSSTSPVRTDRPLREDRRGNDGAPLRADRSPRMHRGNGHGTAPGPDGAARAEPRLTEAGADAGAGPDLRTPVPSLSAEPQAAATRIRNALECLLLARGGPVRLSDLRKVLEVGEDEIRATLAALHVEYMGRGLQIQEVAGGYQLCTRPEYSGYVQRLLRLDEMDPLTRATLEVLAIVAYRQPVTRAEVDAVRGVQSVYHLIKLHDRRLIHEIGRRSGPGRPILYGTTEGFLRYFGLKDLTALPSLADHDHSAVLPVAAP